MLSLRIMSLPFIPTSWTRMVGRIITTDHNVPSLGRMLHICSSGMACIIKFNVFHFGLLVSFHIANLRLKISGNEVTPGENRENLHPVKFPMYTCMHVYLRLSSFLPPYTCTFTNSHQRRLRWFSCSPLFYNTLRVLNYSNIQSILTLCPLVQCKVSHKIGENHNDFSLLFGRRTQLVCIMDITSSC